MKIGVPSRKFVGFAIMRRGGSLLESIVRELYSHREEIRKRVYDEFRYSIELCLMGNDGVACAQLLSIMRRVVSGSGIRFDIFKVHVHELGRDMYALLITTLNKNQLILNDLFLLETDSPNLEDFEIAAVQLLKKYLGYKQGYTTRQLQIYIRKILLE